MKYLTLIRHAKSSWKEAGLCDFDRPLNKRGQRDLPGLAERASHHLPRPDRLLFSPALRTSLTREPLVRAWQLQDDQCLAAPQAYEATAETLLQLLQDTPDAINHLVLVGHNPGLSDLTALISGQPMDYFPTSAFAHLSLDLEHWSTLTAGCGKLLQFDYPKLHAANTDENQKSQ
ncbi:SixA phosphatase family protein [Marinospirillum alkaliphilum]|uniref:Phosphohistidine phosphatase n=1 Tax=Marinospirillum alkaliphilum DSM 21637 TaxID=1122209 RepID=A0A1K1TMV0_9GAMM|nr:histidine phosphatase family protein [Marinospirillum alkaliphilum]SFX01684.1 phosphohistidine phosphatase [Marinospirillum alkaliphilum DSM 21637]